jgi:methyl halide transferase
MIENTTVLDQNYWNTRWETGATGWDIGFAAPAIVQFMQQETDKNAAILIAGCGSAHEAAALVEMGFTDITLIDIAPEAAQKLREKFSNTPEIKVLCADFFEHTGVYDLVVEQTFFCAIDPHLRPHYVEKMASLLNPKGRIIGLLFSKEFTFAGPPFGGTAAAYKGLFKPLFEIKMMENTPLSIPQRMGTELFIIFQKK